MTSFLKILAISLAIYLTEITEITADLQIETFENEWIMPVNSSQFIVQADYRHTFDRNDHTFHYAICELANSNEVVCNVKLERWGSVQNFCTNTKLKPKDKTRTMYDPYNIYLLPFDDTVMLVWTEKSLNATEDSFDYLGVKILNITKCKSTRLAFLVEYSASFFYSFPLVLYEKTVDFFTDNNYTCGNKEIAEKNGIQPPICRLTYNLTGHLISIPRPFLPSIDMIGYLQPTVLSPNYTSLFSSALDANRSELVITLLDLDGKSFELMRSNLNESEDSIQVMMGQSNDQKMYGICWVSQLGSKSISCAQFDAFGNLTLNVSVQAKRTVKWVDVYNLAEGGMLIIAGRCYENGENKYLDCQGFQIWKIQPDGSYNTPFDVNGLDLRCFSIEDGFTMRIAENKTGTKYCFYFTCLEVPENQSSRRQILQFSSKCMSK